VVRLAFRPDSPQFPARFGGANGAVSQVQKFRTAGGKALSDGVLAPISDASFEESSEANFVEIVRSVDPVISSTYFSTQCGIGPQRRAVGNEPISAYCAVMPPSMTSSEPVTQDDSSDARNRTPLAISSAVPSRPIGVRSSSIWRTAGSLKRSTVSGVSA
jgi:hypothetical protein